MRTNEYCFVSRWRVPASRESVTEILTDAEALPKWWPSVYLSVLKKPDGVFDLHTRGWLPYSLRWRFRVTSDNRPHGFALEAWGDLEGTGIWAFAPRGDWTEIVYEWRVRAEKPLLRYLSFLFQPLFAANHRWAMARGEESLKRELIRRKAIFAASAISAYASPNDCIGPNRAAHRGAREEGRY